jgi:iron complex outermembrane receptor protein
MNKLLITILSFLIITIQTHAQETLNNILDPITIYGHLLQANKEQSGKNITVITASELDNYMFNSIDELLKLIPSIELQSRGGFSNQSDIVLRGSTFNQTLVLLDGMRVNDPLTGHFSMYIPITISDIHQIEIIRGGGSSMYGPDAVGGIVNIVTKSFNNLQNKEEVAISAKVGQNYFLSNEIFISKRTKNKSYSTISSNITKSDGQELYDDTFSFFDNKTMSISHHYNPSDDLAVSLRASYAKRYFNSKYYYTRSPYDDSNELIKKLWTQAKIDYKINSNSNIDFNYSYQSVNDKYIFMPGLIYKNKTKLFNNRINYTIDHNESQLAVGLDFQNRQMESIDRGTHSDQYFGGYINYLKNLNNLSINPSARLDYNQSYNLQICPQLDMNYNNESFVLRSSIGRTIRSADFTERYYNNKYEGTLAAGRNIGNPNLDAESTWNAEVGIDIKKYSFVQFNSTLFYRRSSNLIDWVLTESASIPIEVELLENETYFFAQNISKLHTIGSELELWFILLNADNIDISGSAGYVKIYSSATAEDLLFDDVSSKYLANNSGDKLNYNISVDIKKVKFNVNGIFKSRNSESDLTINQSLNSSYFIHNFEVNLKLSKSAMCSVEVMNVFNVEYVDILGAIMPKRWVLLGFNYQI